MSRVVDIRPCRCRRYCWLRDRTNICLWILKDNSGLRSMTICQRIWWLARCHEWMWNTEEPVHVVTGTLPWQNTDVTCCSHMVRIVHPPIVCIIKQHPWIDRWSRTGLGVSKLPHDPLWSVIHKNEPPAQQTGITWNHMEVLDRSVLPIWDPTDIWNPESVQAFPVHQCTYALHGLLRSNPTTGTRWILVVVWINSRLRDWGKVLVYPALQR